MIPLTEISILPDSLGVGIVTDFNDICFACMQQLCGQEVCPNCGEKKGEPQRAPFLPKKTILGSRYMIGKGLEMNGEGLSYVGYDTVKNCKVYIKEFFPVNLCARGMDIKKVAISSYRKALYYQELDEFSKYFRSVARLRNLPLLAAVYDIFEENNTSYVVIEWISGTKLDKFIAKQGYRLDWDTAKPMFLPLICALSSMHDSGVLHLGISPVNMFVTKENKIMLSGFATKDLRRINSPLEAQLYDGCSALEQYIQLYEMDESTDVYALTASLFLTLTGEYPEIATKRKKDDSLFMPKEIVRTLPENVVSAIANGLKVYPNNRTLSFENLKAELLNSPVAQISFAKKYNVDRENLPIRRKDIEKKKHTNFIWGIVSCVIALVSLILCFVVYWMIFKRDTLTQNQTNNSDINEITGSYSENSQETVSKITVPNLIGKNFKDLQNQDKEAAGYDVLLLSEDFNDGISEGCVISQTPGVGEEVYTGSSIAVNVSKGSKMRKLPEITGKSVSETSIAISSLGIIPLESWDYSEDVPEGKVIGYLNHKPGDLIEYASEVTIIRSLGHK